MALNILICGIGGQGTVLAAKVISAAALNKGEKVLSAETIGMAQRGGCVTSHVRIGSDAFSPLIGKKCADLLISFEASEAVRNASYLKDGGTLIVASKSIQPITASLSGKSFSVDAMLQFLSKVSSNIITVDTDAACKELGSAKVANMVLLGAACKQGILDIKQIKEAVKSLVKEDFYQLNCKALDWGYGN